MIRGAARVAPPLIPLAGLVVAALATAAALAARSRRGTALPFRSGTPDPAPPTDGAVLLASLAAIVGRRHVLTGVARTRRFRRGYRTGEGQALAVVRPGSLLEQWRVVQACVAADRIVLMQAANTGLTGGSTPDGGLGPDGYDREIVIVSTSRMNRVRLLDGGRQALCFPGTTLDLLERTLNPLGREPHSVIGSSCLGASVMGGVANNSGGALVRRGPAYTELALFARVDEDGRLALVDRLGIALGDDPETVLGRLDRDDFPEDAVRWDAGLAHDADYATRVRDTGSDQPARHNADPGRLRDASGSAGRLILFAVRLDTFPAEPDAQCFYAGTGDPDAFAALRRRILADPARLPIACEYMHRDAFDLADRFGKDTVLAIARLGTARLPKLFALKAALDRIAERVPLLPDTLSDRLLQRVGGLFPDHLPPRLRRFRDRFPHHLLLKVSAADADAMQRTLEDALGADGFFRCTPAEGARAFLHRFAAAGAAVRFRALHPRTVPDIVAVDVALPRNTLRWFETLPSSFNQDIAQRLYYGHFLCHVLHQDYILRPGAEAHAVEHRILETLAARGARAPAEHNVGHLYDAPPSLAAHYRALDPCNCFNPGIGHTSKRRHWAGRNGTPPPSAPLLCETASPAH